jgi:hypothetical protein
MQFWYQQFKSFVGFRETGPMKLLINSSQQNADGIQRLQCILLLFRLFVLYSTDYKVLFD